MTDGDVHNFFENLRELIDDSAPLQMDKLRYSESFRLLVKRHIRLL